MKEDWVEETCIVCYVSFGITKGHHDLLVKNHKNFYCPRGHGQHYLGETDEQKYKKQLNQVEQKYQNENKRLITLVMQKQDEIRKLETQDNKTKADTTEDTKKDKTSDYFSHNDVITRVGGVPIIKQVVADLLAKLPKNKTFKSNKIEELLKSCYKEKLDRKLSIHSLPKYAWSYKHHLINTKKIQYWGNGMRIVGDSKEESPPLPANKDQKEYTDLEKWLIAKLPRKPFCISDFLKDYPDTNKKILNQSISDLINKKILSQRENNRFKLLNIKTWRET